MFVIRAAGFRGHLMQKVLINLGRPSLPPNSPSVVPWRALSSCLAMGFPGKLRNPLGLREVATEKMPAEKTSSFQFREDGYK